MMCVYGALYLTLTEVLVSGDREIAVVVDTYSESFKSMEG